MKITFNKAEYKNIYIPNDDSYLFLDALKLEAPSFPQNSIVVEMGSGSGILIGNVSKILQDLNNRALYCIGIDINYDACIATYRNTSENQVYCDCINADGFKGLNFNKFGIDIFIFNPPYVPTEDDEYERSLQYFKEKQKLFQDAYKNNLRDDELINEMYKVNLIDCSYSGGKDGMQVTWKILDQVTKLMNQNGIIYLFVIQDNPVNEIVNYFKKQGYECFIIKQYYEICKQQLQIMNKIISKFAKSLSTQAPIQCYHFPNGSVYTSPAVTAKRIIKVVGERLRKIDPERWESTPITFNTNWNDAAGYVDVATCIHIHDALEKEFGIEIKDRAFLVSSIETAFYIVNIHHDSH